MNGYAGKILRMDLSNKEISENETPKKLKIGRAHV